MTEKTDPLTRLVDLVIESDLREGKLKKAREADAR